MAAGTPVGAGRALLLSRVLSSAHSVKLCGRSSLSVSVSGRWAEASAVWEAVAAERVAAQPLKRWRVAGNHAGCAPRTHSPCPTRGKPERSAAAATSQVQGPALPGSAASARQAGRQETGSAGKLLFVPKVAAICRCDKKPCG